MSADVVADAPVSTKPKKTAKPKKPASHPKYSDMIQVALTNLKERGGSSRQAILKYILANFKVDAAAANAHLKMALRAGVKNGNLKQSKGTGASGSFRLGEKKAEKMPKVKKAKKPKAAKPKKTKKPKKAAGEKKVKVKKAKSPKKKTPKKPKSAKPKAVKPKVAKKAKSPKKKASKKAAKK